MSCSRVMKLLFKLIKFCNIDYTFINNRTQAEPFRQDLVFKFPSFSQFKLHETIIFLIYLKSIQLITINWSIMIHSLH